MSTVSAVTYARKEYVFFLLLYPLLWLFLSSQIALSDSADVWRAAPPNQPLKVVFVAFPAGGSSHG